MTRKHIVASTVSKGFTLVEVLIVVVILGILATAVIPMVSSASTDAVKSALRRQIQSIDHQIEIYRVSNQGILPTADPVSPLGGPDNGGWGILISEEYLKEAPFNGYVSQFAVTAGTAAAAEVIEPPTAFGWYYELTPDGTQLFVYAAGYDKADDLLAHEQP
jgi:prepilin-type N-terminal cleavage/methylation domain-containing protein